VTTTLPRPTSPQTAPETRGLRPWYALMLVGGLLGLFTAGWQTVERIAWASDPNATSVCEINSVLSCSSVFSHWQSSALGVPNSLIAMGVFGFIGSAGLAGVLGSRLSRGYLATVFGLTVFMTAFVVWYLEQSALSIGVLCLFCVGCAVNIVLAGIGVTRVASRSGALGQGGFGRGVAAMVEARADVVAWVGLAALLALMMVLGLAL
jgi:uncharacterized membrane protein